MGVAVSVSGELGRRAVDRQTHLVVVVFRSIYNRDIPSLQTLARGLETVVQLLGDAKSAGTCPDAGLNGRAK
jgi:hypothetical protein